MKSASIILIGNFKGKLPLERFKGQHDIRRQKTKQNKTKQCVMDLIKLVKVEYNFGLA
jgi:hypothetical protein